MIMNERSFQEIENPPKDIINSIHCMSKFMITSSWDNVRLS